MDRKQSAGVTRTRKVAEDTQAQGGELEARIRESVTAQEASLVQMLVDLIEMPTLRLTGAHFREGCEYVREALERAGLEARVGRVSDDAVEAVSGADSHYRFLGLNGPISDRYYVVGELRGSSSRKRGKRVHLNGHLCVVEPVDGWQSDPFSARVADGAVAGCGAIDMKGGLVMIIGALRALQEVVDPVQGDVTVSVTVDTHFGGNLGAGYIVERNLGRADFVIVGDTSGPSTILNGYRGQLWVKIETHGTATHGSTPRFGQNAVERMAAVIGSLQEYRAQLDRRESDWHIIPADAKRPSLSIGTTIEGGRCMNLVPDRCVMTLDRRLIPEESPDDALSELTAAVLRGVGGDRSAVDVTLLFSAPPTATSEDSQLVKTMQNAASRMIGRAPVVVVHPAFLDLQWFTTRWGIPGVVYGPGSGGVESEFRRKPYREPEESLAVCDLLAATEVLTLALAELTGSASPC
jgi:succinyl-diaminopimelate desuccinylase